MSETSISSPDEHNIELVDAPTHQYTFFVSDKAKAKAIEQRDKYTTPPFALRVGVLSEGCHGYGYKLEWRHEKFDNDLEFNFGGLKVIIDPKSIKYLNGTTLEWEENLLGYGFKFNNPNVKSLCGCGTSFEV